MSAKRTSGPVNPLPSAFEGLEIKGFTRRLPASQAESERDDMIYGVKGLDDLLSRADQPKRKLPAKR